MGLEEPCPPRSRTTCDWDIDILWRLRAAGPLPQQRCPNVAPVQSRLGANSLTWPFKWHLTHWMHWRNVWRLGRLGEDRWRAISVLRRKRLDCWIHNSQICSCSHTASSRSISCLVADAKLKAMCLPELISGRCNVYIYYKLCYVLFSQPRFKPTNCSKQPYKWVKSEHRRTQTAQKSHISSNSAPRPAPLGIPSTDEWRT